MQTAYNVTIEFATPPLKREETYLVRDWADVLALREMAKHFGYRVVSYTSAGVLRYDEVINKINREKLETRRAIGEAA